MYYAAQQYCASSFLWWCTAHGYRRIAVYESSLICCPGYMGSDCKTPICNPPCAHGGTCVSPNKCDCPDIVGGDSCQELVKCSYLNPCFPGTCINGTTCSCNQGFSGDSCLQLEPENAKILSLNTTLINVKRSDNRKLYEFNADAFSTFKSIWVNRKSYNYFLIYFETIYNPDIPFPPSYINGSAVGIVSAHSRVTLAKIGRAGNGTTDVSLNTTIPCPGSFNDSVPYNEVLKCNISFDQFDRTLEDGDDLSITAVVEVGGYRHLWNGTHVHQRQIFNHSLSQAFITFLFDFSKPKHCSFLRNCPADAELPLNIHNDASKGPFKFDVGAWSDIPSGIQKYFLEVHFLQKRLHTDTLTEKAPMEPFFREERNETSLPFPEFTPPEPGVYSVILQVTDKANNSEFARQIVIYDPNSTITNTAETNFYVPSAEKESNYRWQSRCSTVQVTWRDYFENSFQVANNFLLPVEEFPTQFRGGNVEEVKDEIVKKVTKFYDDHDGKRTVSGVTHINGITEFEFLYTYISYSNSSTDTGTSVDTNIVTEATTKTLSTEDFNTTTDFYGKNSTNMVLAENTTSELISVENKTSTTASIEKSNDTQTNASSTVSLNGSDFMTSFTVPSTDVMTSFTVPSTDVMTSFTVPSTTLVTNTSSCLSMAYRSNTENQWIRMENILDSSFVIEHEWKDGDSINISVRARDIVNNTMVATRVVSFDSSPPYSSEAIFTKNTGNRIHRFSSSVRIRAWDEHSGIRQVQWRLRNKNKPEEIHDEGFFHNDPLELSDCANPKDCYCIPKGECFRKDMTFEFNNCWLAMEKPLLSNGVFLLELEAFNQAILSSNVTHYELNQLTSFDGIDDSPGITNLRSQDLGNGIKLTWEIVPSCYNVSYISVLLYTDCDKSTAPKEIALPTDKTEFELTNLESGMEFCLEVISNNTGHSQAIVDSLTFKTSPAIPVALIAAVSTVIGVLLVLVVVFIILWRNGHVKPETKRRLTMYLKRPVTLFQGGRKSGFYSGRFQDDDIYDFGKMVFTANEGWLFGFDDIDLKGKLKSGDFADIYLAKICKKDMAVAKILKEDYTEEDCLVLKAKISFFAMEVPPHDNIIQFLGSVLNHPVFGPYMLMEYCELGQMREWLLDQKNKVNDDLITDFCKMVLGIAKGMETLSIKGIIHKRLATRNVLLTSRLVPKIAGFGPTPEEGENEVDQKMAKERKPIKWLAPECYESMKYCTSMSDVWAFGVVIWEIFSTGQNPYHDIDPKVVPMKVASGYRMRVPEFCPDTQGSLMESCWAKKPEDRPAFTNIVSTLESYYDARFPYDFEDSDEV